MKKIKKLIAVVAICALTAQAAFAVCSEPKDTGMIARSDIDRRPIGI